MKVEVGESYIVKEDGHGYKKGNVFNVVMFDFTRNKVHIIFENGVTFQEDANVMERLHLEVYRVSESEPSKPAHYDTGIDTIAFMRANCPPEQVEGFLRGNALKYLQRYDKKNGVDDLRKARHYVEMLIEELEGRE